MEKVIELQKITKELIELYKGLNPDNNDNFKDIQIFGPESEVAANLYMISKCEPSLVTTIKYDGSIPNIYNDKDNLLYGVEIKSINGINIPVLKHYAELGECGMANFSKFLAYTSKDSENIKKIYEKIKDKFIKKGNFYKKLDPGTYKIKEKNNIFGTSYYYESFDIKNNIPIVHTELENIKKEINFFLNNTEAYKKYGLKPFRKLLLTGEPGTGKTSICYELAKTYKDLPIVYISNYACLQKHMSNLELAPQKCIIILEDIDSVFRNVMRNGILNFLDGADTPDILEPVIAIMTTNDPKAIDERITKRPGRIDRIFSIGALFAEDSYHAFVNYFKDLMNSCNFDYNSEKHKKAIEIIANNMTGAQIKELYNSYICYLATENKEFNLIDILEIKNRLYDSFKKVDETKSSLDIFDFSSVEQSLKAILN